MIEQNFDSLVAEIEELKTRVADLEENNQVLEQILQEKDAELDDMSRKLEHKETQITFLLQHIDNGEL